MERGVTGSREVGIEIDGWWMGEAVRIYVEEGVGP